MTTHIDTEEQAVGILRTWGIDAPLPRKGKRLLITFPPDKEFKLAKIEVAPQKSTNGKILYKMILGNSLEELG